MALTVKNLPAMQETWVRSLGQEDSLEKGMATHASILAWRIPWTKEPGGLVHGVTKSNMTEQLIHTHTHIYMVSILYIYMVSITYPVAQQ